jgi:hypothetical protein
MNARLRSGFGDIALRVRTATPRERLMLAALGFVGMLIMLSAGIRLTRTSLAAWRETKAAVAHAEVLLAAAPAVDAALTAKSARLAGKNISPSDLLAAVDTLARELGLNVDAGAPRAEKTGKLVVHRFRVGLRAPDIRKLMDFDDRLRLNDKGIIVERVTVEARAESELSAAYELAACQPAE